MKGLETSIRDLKTIAPKKSEVFEKNGIVTIRDLLFYFPSQYLDRTSILTSEKIAYYVANGFDSEVTMIGKVQNTEIINSFRKKMLKVIFSDNEGLFEAIFFNGISHFSSIFIQNAFFAISSKPKITRYGHLQFIHPEFDKLTTNESYEFKNTGKIIPYYRIPKDLREKKIGDVNFRNLVKKTVLEFSSKLEEYLPQSILSENNLLPLIEMINKIHVPTSKTDLEQAWYRVKFEELLIFELRVAKRKKIMVQAKPESKISFKTNEINTFLKNLPFQLTEDQLEVLHEIRMDLESQIPMNRLLQGDVGSGKTIVAFLSALMTISSGKQAVLMVPTEILANQHFVNSISLFKNNEVKIALLLGSQTKSERNIIQSEIASGEIDLIIGTHTVFQEKIIFKNLGLVIIDEQHRFGVGQRLQLIEKGISPNILIMSATPIPRTLSLTIYGDLDISTIRNLPPGRKEITTVLRNESKLDSIYDFVKQKINDENIQVFIVYPLVDESEKIEIKAATEQFEILKTKYFSEYSVGLIHGKMNWIEKEQVMKDFANGMFQILVSTTVIEVGMDVPNANIILINEANRFGLSQLHQLRGRVGRGKSQAFCILITKENYILPNAKNFNFEFLSKSELEKHKTAIRLDAIVNNSDGFLLAEIDLKIRGQGDVFGFRQSGEPILKYVDLIRDFQILENARKSAFSVIENDFALSKEENRNLVQLIQQNDEPIIG